MRANGRAQPASREALLVVKVLLQRVSAARVEIAGELVGAIEVGLLALVGVEQGDSLEQARWLADKTLGLRIFPDDNKPMNINVLDVGGGVLAVSQFTLAAETSRGNRPGFSSAAAPDVAEPLFDAYVARLRTRCDLVETGRFGADMQVSLTNDGPVTFLLSR